MATRFDIHFQILPSADQLGEQVFGFGFTSAVGVRGPQKLINRWLKCFMTPQGTDPFNPKYGTGFGSLIGSNIGNIDDVKDAVALFVQDCNAQVKKFDLASGTPANERLSSATIIQVVERASDGFDVYIGITNTAGQQTPVQLPSISVR